MQQSSGRGSSGHLKSSKEQVNSRTEVLAAMLWLLLLRLLLVGFFGQRLFLHTAERERTWPTCERGREVRYVLLCQSGMQQASAFAVREH